MAKKLNRTGKKTQNLNACEIALIGKLLSAHVWLYHV